MNDDVPPAKQCDFPRCTREAVNPERAGALCTFHEPDSETDSAGNAGEDNPEEPDSSDTTPTPESVESHFEGAEWDDADFTDPESGVWPPEILEREQWMGHVKKKPFAPWADRDHAEAGPDEDARWKWGITDNYVDGETIAMGEVDDRLDGRAFLQQFDDPYAYVDGDDVRDPETGTVHPAFLEVLERLGLTYADVSQSGAGSHAIYRGELPAGVKEAAWQLDDEPWGENDDLPSIEIYDGKRVCVATGEHVSGTPTEIREWDDDALEEVLEENDQLATSPDRPERDDLDLESHEPTATTADETTTDVRDILAALDRLDARRVAEETIVQRWNDDASTSDGARAFWPTWGSLNDNGTANYVNENIWHDTGDEGGYGTPVVMALIDAGEISHRNASPRDVRNELWWQAVDHLRDLGFSIPEYVSHDDREKTDPRDLLEKDVIVEPTKAGRAARAVEPDDLDVDVPAFEHTDSVVLAVAAAEGLIEDIDDLPADSDYARAYRLAREKYGAPLPKYLDNATLAHRTDEVFAAASEVDPEHVLAAAESTVTVDDPAGAAVAKLDPTWEDSESGERILAGYGRGFWCVEHEVSFDVIQFVSLEQDLIDDETDYPTGEAFKRAYKLARDHYGAPLPKWRANLLEHVAVLPPAARVLGEASAAPSLTETHDRVEALLRDAVTTSDYAQLLTCLPNTGKTYSTVKVAADHPVAYFAGRNDLKSQLVEYIHDVEAETGASISWMHLPILAENTLSDLVLRNGVEAVHTGSRELLQDRERLLDVVGEYIEDDEEAGGENDLDRASCPTAEGDHGEAWRVALQIAHELGHDPVDLHVRAKAIFGEELPCDHDGDCAYTRAWERARNPDNPLDLVIGSPGHAFVASARTYFERDGPHERKTTPRALVFDEFPDSAFQTEFGDTYMDHATWLAGCLRDGVDTREDLIGAKGDLANDAWVSAWLDGDGSEIPTVERGVARLEAGAKLLEAAGNAAELQDDLDIRTSATLPRVRDALADVADVEPPVGADSLDTLTAALTAAHDDLIAEADRAYGRGDDHAGALYTVAGDVERQVLEPLQDAVATVAGATGVDTVGGDDPLGDVSIGGDLAALVEAAAEAVQARRDASGLVEAAATALEGGREGCRELAVHADDGYAHPKACLLLAGALADVDDDGVAGIGVDDYTFDHDESTTLKRVEHDDALLLADKNHKGTLVRDTPAYTGIEGGSCAVIGLDATGRTELWQLALGRTTQRRDIHDTDRERRRFLEESMNLHVVQTTTDALPYHGNPAEKHFGEDLELVRDVADEYTGDGAVDDDKPVVLSTLKVLEYLEDDLADHIADTVHYMDMKGDDSLGDHQVGVILGSPHFGDGAPEKWAALAGEEAERGDTYGMDLDYGSDAANAYLQYMREDHVMQGILRMGRNDEMTVVAAHTGALRDDLPVVEEGAVVSAHSRGVLEVVEVAKQHREGSFTVADVAAEVESIDRRQVLNVLDQLADQGYVCRVRDGGPGRAHEFDLKDDPGLADVELPDIETGENEISRNGITYTWNFDFATPDSGATGLLDGQTPAIDVTEAVSDPGPPPTAAD